MKKKPITATVLSPPCSFGAAKQGRRGGQGWSEARLQSRKCWSQALSCSPERGPQRFSTHLRPLESDLPIYHFYFPHPAWGEFPGGLSCVPGPCPLLSRAVPAGSAPELCLWRRLKPRPAWLPNTLNFSHTLCQYLVRDSKATGGLL